MAFSSLMILQATACNDRIAKIHAMIPTMPVNVKQYFLTDFSFCVDHRFPLLHNHNCDQNLFAGPKNYRAKYINK